MENPYVHPKTLSDGRQMLNQVGNDGYSFDEIDDDDDFSESVKQLSENSEAIERQVKL